MKAKNKIIIAIILTVLILITNLLIIINSVKASSLTEIPQIELHSRGICGQLLEYKGVIVKTTYVEYTYNGTSYPAYCLDKTLPGISSELIYSVGTQNKVEDIGLWRTVISGYPYKSLEELGVATEEEAFTATKQAIYCYLFENEPSDYAPIGEEGQRTLNALYKIVDDGKKSTETQIENAVQVKTESEDWIEDENNSNYIYKIYSIKSAVNNLDYEVEFEGNKPNGSQIANLNGEKSNRFSEKEKFKVMLLKDSLIQDGSIKLKVKTEVKTKPVIYGASPDASWQNYALTGYMYEDATVVFNDNYKKYEKPEKPVVPKVEQPKEEIKILPVTGM